MFCIGQHGKYSGLSRCRRFAGLPHSLWGQAVIWLNTWVFFGVETNRVESSRVDFGCACVVNANVHLVQKIPGWKFQFKLIIIIFFNKINVRMTCGSLGGRGGGGMVFL